jgi:hypothetical protein
MSPLEMDKYRNDLCEAAERFGWKRHRYTENHERDDSSSWDVWGWVNQRGEWIIGDSDITPALADSLIAISKTLKILSAGTAIDRQILESFRGKV